MSVYFFDSSALVKRYAPETGSAWVTNLTQHGSGHDIVIAEVTLVEVSAALNAKARTPGGLTTTTRDQNMTLFLQDCDTRYVLVATTRRFIDRVVDFTKLHPLRGYDAVQLAIGWLFNADLVVAAQGPLVFVSADQTLLDAAHAEGLATENPQLHP